MVMLAGWPVWDRMHLLPFLNVETGEREGTCSELVDVLLVIYK